MLFVANAALRVCPENRFDLLLFLPSGGVEGWGGGGFLFKRDTCAVSPCCCCRRWDHTAEIWERFCILSYITVDHLCDLRRRQPGAAVAGAGAALADKWCSLHSLINDGLVCALMQMPPQPVLRDGRCVAVLAALQCLPAWWLSCAASQPVEGCCAVIFPVNTVCFAQIKSSTAEEITTKSIGALFNLDWRTCCSILDGTRRAQEKNTNSFPEMLPAQNPLAAKSCRRQAHQRLNTSGLEQNRTAGVGKSPQSGPTAEVIAGH